MSGQHVLGQIPFSDHIHPQGSVACLLSDNPIAVKAQPCVPCLGITKLHIICYHHNDRGFQPLCIVRFRQCPVGGFQPGTDCPFPHGRPLLKGYEDGLYSQPGALCAWHVIQTVRHHITGILFQFHKCKVIIIFQLRPGF